MIYRFTGTAYERGRQHGTALKKAIHDRVRQSLPADTNAESRHHVAKPWLDAIEELDPELTRELAGIAAGSGLTLDEIVLLNSFEAFKSSEKQEKGGCTLVGVSTRNRSVLGQNWDANSLRAVGLAVHHHRDPNSADVAVLASPGGLGWIGMNEHGLALVNNDLIGRTITNSAPSQAIRRFILKQVDTLTAVKVSRSISHPALRSYALSDPMGNLAAMEVMPNEKPATTLNCATVVHANHAVTPIVQDLEDSSKQKETFPSSNHRASRAAELLTSRLADEDPRDRVLRILRDHDGLPLSICRHPHMSEVTSTVASAVFDCSRRIAQFNFGHTCEPQSSETVEFPYPSPPHKEREP